MSNERRARLILNALPHMGPVTLRRLLDDIGSPETILAAPRGRLLAVRGVGPSVADAIAAWRTHFDPAEEERRLRAHGADFVIPSDPDYPALLRETYDPPIGLYRMGGYVPGVRCVAVVGTRRPTSYGKDLAREVSGELAKAGWCIVSGLARGVDAEAHRAALDAGGGTVAVLGCGADIVYPAENLGLYRDIVSSGAILSEFPFGRTADKRTFPMRNRIVAGMCRAVVVIESDKNGGSMITARFAAEGGRTVCAFPGRVDQLSSRGCHALIRDGATLVTSAGEILEELGEPAGQSEFDLGEAVADVSDETGLLVHFAGGATHTPDSLAEKTARPVGEISAGLLGLEIEGALVRLPQGAYEIARRKRSR